MNCLQPVLERIVLHHILFTFLSSCHNIRRSHCFEPRDGVWNEKEQTNRLQQVSGTFMLCPVLCGHVASWWPCRCYPKVPTVVLNTLGQNLLKKKKSGLQSGWGVGRPPRFVTRFPVLPRFLVGFIRFIRKPR